MVARQQLPPIVRVGFGLLSFGVALLSFPFPKFDHPLVRGMVSAGTRNRTAAHSRTKLRNLRNPGSGSAPLRSPNPY